MIGVRRLIENPALRATSKQAVSKQTEVVGRTGFLLIPVGMQSWSWQAKRIKLAGLTNVKKNPPACYSVRGSEEKEGAVNKGIRAGDRQGC